MKVYRVISFEGSPRDIAEQLSSSVQGTYQPGHVTITSAAVEPRIIEAQPMIMHALALASMVQWTPPPKRTNSPGAEPDVDAAKFIQRITELLEDGGYEWAEGTLSGVLCTVERTGQVTEGQFRAVNNIEHARKHA